MGDPTLRRTATLVAHKVGSYSMRTRFASTQRS